MTTPQISGKYQCLVKLKNSAFPITFTIPDIPDMPLSEEVCICNFLSTYQIFLIHLNSSQSRYNDCKPSHRMDPTMASWRKLWNYHSDLLGDLWLVQDLGPGVVWGPGGVDLGHINANNWRRCVAPPQRHPHVLDEMPQCDLIKSCELVRHFDLSRPSLLISHATFWLLELQRWLSQLCHHTYHTYMHSMPSPHPTSLLT